MKVECLLSCLLLLVLFVATGQGQEPSPTAIANPVKMFRTTMKSWRVMYRNYKEEMDLGYCWADYFFDVKGFINTLSGPKILGPNRVAAATLKALLRSWLNEPAPPKPSPPTWYEKILLDSPPVPSTTEPAARVLTSPRAEQPAKILDPQETPQDNAYSGDEDAYSNEDYSNDEPRPIPYTYLNPTQVQQSPNQDQLSRLPKNQLLPRGPVQLLPQGPAQLLPQGPAQLLPQGQVQLLPQGQVQFLPDQSGAQISPNVRGQPVQGRPIYPRYIYPGGTTDSLQRNPQEGYGRGLSRRSVNETDVKATRNETRSEIGDVEDLQIGRSAANGLTLRSSAEEARGLGDLFVSVLGFDTPPGVGALRFNVEPSPVLIVFARIVGTFFRIGRQVLETIDGTSILACSKNYLATKFFRWIDTA